MKQLYTSAMLLILSAAGIAQTIIKDQSDTKLRNEMNKKATDANWLNKAQGYIKESEYHFQKRANAFTYCVNNKTQHISFFITSTTYKTSPVKFSNSSYTTSDWEQSLSFKEIRKGKIHLYANDKFTCLQDDANLSYSYGGFSIEYNNAERGLRQNFIVAKKPAGNDDLELLLNTEGSLSPSVLGNGLQFKDNSGDAAYGFSVVAIGATTNVKTIYETTSHANVGAVDIYYGGILGLSTTPSAVLQPTTPVAGACLVTALQEVI